MLLTIRFLLGLYLIYVYSSIVVVADVEVAFIEVGDFEWESLPVDGNGERRITCRNFDQAFKGQFQWRYNGSSILPATVRSVDSQIIFSNASNAKRRQLIGTYDCCVKEEIGDGCYRTHLRLKDAVQTIGMNIENTTEVVTVEGNSYFLRLFPVKKLKSITCTLNQSQTLPGNIIFNTKNAHQQKKKFHDYYQMKISDVDATNAGKYVCESEVFDKGTSRKVFNILVEKEKRMAIRTELSSNEQDGKSLSSPSSLRSSHSAIASVILLSLLVVVQ